jgi:hypothetical protein
LRIENEFVPLHEIPEILFEDEEVQLNFTGEIDTDFDSDWDSDLDYK